MSEEKEIIDPSPAESATPTEKNLLEDYLELCNQVDMFAAKLKDLNKQKEDAERSLIQALKDENKTASARYEGIGHACIMTGPVYASIAKGRQDDVKDFIRKIGREDMIKETIAPATLSTFIRECLEKNEPLPDGVGFYRPEYIRFYPAKP